MADDPYRSPADPRDPLNVIEGAHARLTSDGASDHYPGLSSQFEMPRVVLALLEELRASRERFDAAARLAEALASRVDLLALRVAELERESERLRAGLYPLERRRS